MNRRILCIGAGSMGGAILQGALETGVWKPNQVHAVVHTESSAEKLRHTCHIEASTSCPSVFEYDVILLAVKPQIMGEVLPYLRDCKEGTLIISLAAGLTLDSLVPSAPNCEWVRAMPNTPVLVKAGLTALTKDLGCSDESMAYAKHLFEILGAVIVCTELDVDRLGALAGAGPGFLFTILDALTNAGVAIGLTRPVAQEAAAQTLYGSGLLAVETKRHPSDLRDQVTSPGGTTIAGILAMEKQGIRTAMSAAVESAYTRSKELGRK